MSEEQEESEKAEVDELQQAMQRAAQTHQTMSNTKSWALEVSRQVEKQNRKEFEDGEIDADEYEQAMENAEYIRSVYRRIEHGDSNVAQVKGSF